MRREAFQKLMLKERGVREASKLSGYATSSYYYRPKERIIIVMNKRIDLAVLEAIEREVLEHWCGPLYKENT